MCVLFASYVRFHIYMAAHGEIAAHSAYDMSFLFRYPTVNLVFSHLGFWSGNFFLIAPFPDHCFNFYLLTFTLPIPWEISTG